MLQTLLGAFGEERRSPSDQLNALHRIFPSDKDSGRSVEVRIISELALDAVGIGQGIGRNRKRQARAT